jgi:ribonuclease P protein component
VTRGASERFRRTDRLRKRRDYQRVSREGTRLNSSSFVLMAVPRRERDQHTPRLGITTSRRVGPAVTRSLVKRRIREWFRRHRGELPVGRDIVVIARASMAVETPAVLERELSTAVARLMAMVSNPAVHK